MVKIRLMRVGKRKQPSYRVVVADARSPRDGRFIENIGKYNPRVHPSLIDIDDERAIHWLQRGAQPSDPVKVLFQKTGIWARFTGEPPPAPSDQAASTDTALDSAPVARGAPSAEPRAESEPEGEPESSPEGTPLVTEGGDEGSTAGPSAGSDDDEGQEADGA
jgi:small subunit ribosomal protein S16